ncbi:MAG: DUF4125 family protein [Oscillospiraceae bacterium]|jgi:hypothetical protein|nr:DUF4125 family protein [Oscillospiraceae bacterium]
MLSQTLAAAETVDRIVSREWNMFHTVNEGGARAACQDDRVTFDGMRRGQFDAWSQEAAESYLGDLEDAERSGRNLVSEKYIHMMRTTEPSKYEQLLSQIEKPSESARALAGELSDKLLAQTEALFEKYPYVAGSGRPLRSAHDFGGVVSVETYQLGELLTYSARTLDALLRHVLALESEGVSFAGRVLENSAAFYGYKNLDEAETAAKERADGMEFELTYGCASCDSCNPAMCAERRA